jgi:septal ring factor EnvC (AmiA/AmiB activator)
MYPTLTPVGKPSIWYQKKKSRTELYNELSEKEKEIEQINAKELEVKTSLQEHIEQEDEDEEEEGEEEVEEREEEEEEEPEDEGAEDPSIPYHSILSDSVDMEESSLSYMYGSMQEDDEEDEDDDAY